MFKFSSDCKIDASAPIHQMADETKKGTFDVFGPINLEFCRRYLVVFSDDEFSSPFRSVGLTPARLVTSYQENISKFDGLTPVRLVIKNIRNIS